MSPDEELMLIFGVLHLIALVLGVVLFVMFLRSETDYGIQPPEDDEPGGGGGGGNDRVSNRPKGTPGGGIPLPDAEPSPIRLRGHGSLRNARPRRTRRPDHAPAPARRRVPAR
jgi:hypothetical protein